MSESVPARDCRRYGPRHLHAAGGGRQQGEILDTDPDQARQLEGSRGQRREGGGAEGGAAGDPLSGDVAVLAVWYDGAQSAIEQYSTSSTARSSISPIRSTSRPFDGLVTPPDSSAAEELAGKAPQEAKLVKATQPSPGRW